MKLNLPIFILLTIFSNLFSYPYNITRMYNPQLNICVDLISDYHENGTPDWFIIDNVTSEQRNTVKNAIAQRYAQCIAELNRQLKGDLAFICETASEHFFNADDSDSLERFKAEKIRKFDEYCNSIVPKLGRSDLLNYLLGRLKSSLNANAYGKFYQTYSLFTQEFQSLKYDPDVFVKKIRQGSGVGLELSGYLGIYDYFYTDKPLTGQSIDFRLESMFKHRFAFLNDSFMHNLSKTLKKIHPQLAIILSDESRQDVFLSVGIQMKLAQDFMFEYLFQKNKSPQEFIRYFQVATVQWLISLVAIHEGFWANPDAHLRIIAKKCPRLESMWYEYKNRLKGYIEEGLFHVLKKSFTISNTDPAFDKEVVQLLSFNNEIFPSLTNFEMLFNIFACQKSRVVIYTGGEHCKRICDYLEQLGFAFRRELGRKQEGCDTGNPINDKLIMLESTKNFENHWQDVERFLLTPIQ